MGGTPGWHRAKVGTGPAGEKHSRGYLKGMPPWLPNTVDHGMPLQRRRGILTPISHRTGMTRSTFLALRTRSQRSTIFVLICRTALLPLVNIVLLTSRPQATVPSPVAPPLEPLRLLVCFSGFHHAGLPQPLTQALVSELTTIRLGGLLPRLLLGRPIYSRRAPASGG